MKYPKQWEANQVYASWTKDANNESRYDLRCRIQRPGTVDHERPVVIRMTRGNVEALRDQISRLLQAHN